MSQPEFWLIAGPNGAGKTTIMANALLREVSAHVRFLNPDDRTREKLVAEGWSGFLAVPLPRLQQLFIEAAEEVFGEIQGAVESGEAVGSESVLSTHKYRPVVERVRELGGTFCLIYVGLRNAEISAHRVATRVNEGGHDVPSDRLAERWKRSVQNLGWYARQAGRFYVFDNSDSCDGVDPVLIARGGLGSIEIVAPDAIPEITASLTAAFSRPS